MSKVITVILQFEQDRAYSAARPEFVRHFTDMIRVMNANPKLGRLRYAGQALADVMGSISRLDHEAHGAPAADLPRVFTRCDACTNDIVCGNRGGCILAMKAVDKAAEELKKTRGKITITGQSGMRVVEEDFLPIPGWKPPSQKAERKRFDKPEPKARDRSKKQPTANKGPARKGTAGRRGAKAKHGKR